MRDPFKFFAELARQRLGIPLWVSLRMLVNFASLAFRSDPRPSSHNLFRRGQKGLSPFAPRFAHGGRRPGLYSVTVTGSRASTARCWPVM